MAHPTEATDEELGARVRASFDRQPFMVTLGARVAEVSLGRVVIELPHRHELTQQHGFLHAGVVTTIVDNACGYAALTHMPPRAGVLSVEFKVNLLAPAAGEHFVATGRVVKAGRTLSVCSGEMVAERQGKRTVVAVMQATMMAVLGRDGIED